MTNIKNIKLIENILKASQLEKLEAGAALHLRHSRIEFKILEFDGKSVTIRVTQGKPPAENYLSAKEMSALAKELFGAFLPDWDIRTRVFPYSAPTVEVVTPEWIHAKMSEKSIDNKSIIEMTGVDKANISNWISGNKPMFQPVKAMFYFMLK